MISKIKRLLGYHVCEEFTQWELIENEGIKIYSYSGIPVKEVPIIMRYQRRRCTLCGKIQEIRLKD